MVQVANKHRRHSWGERWLEDSYVSCHHLCLSPELRLKHQTPGTFGIVCLHGPRSKARAPPSTFPPESLQDLHREWDDLTLEAGGGITGQGQWHIRKPSDRCFPKWPPQSSGPGKWDVWLSNQDGGGRGWGDTISILEVLPGTLAYQKLGEILPLKKYKTFLFDITQHLA